MTFKQAYTLAVYLTEAAREAEKAGRQEVELTKWLQLADDVARNELVEAIERAKRDAQN